MTEKAIQSISIDRRDDNKLRVRLRIECGEGSPEDAASDFETVSICVFVQKDRAQYLLGTQVEAMERAVGLLSEQMQVARQASRQGGTW